MKEKPGLDPGGPAALIAGRPILARVVEQAGDDGVYLVGGAVRDALLGLQVTDLDIALEGDAVDLALRLDAEALVHERFGTAEVEMDGVRVDLATARTETYPHPGSLPEVTPAKLTDDLRRRDFTINAIAVDLKHPDALIDPFGGVGDLQRRVLRVLHDQSFLDDPTRALRGARYAARLGFDLEPATADLLSKADLGGVSTERVNAELALAAGEESAVKAFSLISRWGLRQIDPARIDLASAALKISESDPWRGLCQRRELILEAVFGGSDVLDSLGREVPASASAAVFMARPYSDCELLVARAAGLEWLDRYMALWARTELEISGDDLIRAGIPRGPEVGRGLDAALVARLDAGEVGFEEELAIALAAARK